MWAKGRPSEAKLGLIVSCFCAYVPNLDANFASVCKRAMAAVRAEVKIKK